MKLTFSTPIQAADTERRVISGKIMEYGAVGHTSVGAVVFEHGSIQIPSPGRIKLLAQHEPNNPIGRAQSFSNEGEFIYGSFKISSRNIGIAVGFFPRYLQERYCSPADNHWTRLC